MDIKITFDEIKKTEHWFCPECGEYANDLDKSRWTWNRWCWLHYCQGEWHAANFSSNIELIREMVHSLVLGFTMMEASVKDYDLRLGTYLDAIMYILRDRQDLIDENKKLEKMISSENQ